MLGGDPIRYVFCTSPSNFVLAEKSQSQQVLQAGIVLQFLSFTFFIANVLLWLKRVSYYEREVWDSTTAGSSACATAHKVDGNKEIVPAPQETYSTNDWRVLAGAVLISSTVLFLRIAYRIFRSRQNFRNDRFYSETMSENEDYVYELTPTLISIAVFALIWPGSFIKGAKKSKADPSV